MVKDEVIERLCAIATKVGNEHFKNSYAHDCFCGQMICSSDVFCFDEPVLRFIETAVKEKLERKEVSNNGDMDR